MIIFTKHAQDKFTILRKHKFIISKEKVLETLNNPDLIDYSRLPLLIAQRKFRSIIRVTHMTKKIKYPTNLKLMF